MATSARIKIIKTATDAETAEELVPALNNLTGNVAKRMRRLVPKDSYRLHDTIEAQPAKVVSGKAVGSVTFGGKVVRGKLVNYHLLVERGTSKMRAQPFARPALYQSRSADLKGMGV